MTFVWAGKWGLASLCARQCVFPGCWPCAWPPGAGAVRTAGTRSGTASFPSSGLEGHLGYTAVHTWPQNKHTTKREEIKCVNEGTLKHTERAYFNAYESVKTIEVIGWSDIKNWFFVVCWINAVKVLAFILLDSKLFPLSKNLLLIYLSLNLKNVNLRIFQNQNQSFETPENTNSRRRPWKA